jgi:catechol 2,3-dioxygenase-like lactoylglutathione lyase family enzyme
MAQLTLHHIHHEAADVDLAAQFYVDNFDAEISQRFERDGVQWARVTLAGAMLNITDRANTDVALSTYRGFDHIGIHTSDFDETIARLRANGVAFYIEPKSPTPGVQMTFVSGPDNVKIEVLSIAEAR